MDGCADGRDEVTVAGYGRGVRKRRSQSQARRKSDERARKRKRKELALQIAEFQKTMYLAFGTMSPEQVQEEMDRRELRARLESQQR